MHPVLWRKLYNAAYKAVKRCTDVNDKYYAGYGGRGILVYEPWQTNIVAFANYLATLPNHDALDYKLDRMQNDRGYEPGNLRFVTALESSNNRRDVVVLAEWRISRLNAGIPLRIAAKFVGCSIALLSCIERGIGVHDKYMPKLIELYTLFASLNQLNIKLPEVDR